MHDQQGQPPFPPMMMIQPPWMQGRQSEYHANEVPARVRVAMECLSMLTYKTGESAVPHGMGAETIPAQELLPVERQLQAAACNMLSEYFAGHLAPSTWEVMLLNRSEGTLVICPDCQAQDPARSSCSSCNGRGRILVRS